MRCLAQGAGFKGLGLRLQRAAPRTGVVLDIELVFGFLEVLQGLGEFELGMGRGARLPSYLDRLPGIAHFLDRGRGFTGAECQSREKDGKECG